MDCQIQVVTVPVTDVDQAAAFYMQQAGFAFDVDYHPAGDFRVVQLTPPGSACSVQFGVGLTDAAPGSARGTYLAVTDIEAARCELGGKRPAKMVPAAGTTASTGPVIVSLHPRFPAGLDLRAWLRRGESHQ
jgi:predicted enzyme related to lactoylglutathione lyase